MEVTVDLNGDSRLAAEQVYLSRARAETKIERGIELEPACRLREQLQEFEQEPLGGAAGTVVLVRGLRGGGRGLSRRGCRLDESAVRPARSDHRRRMPLDTGFGQCPCHDPDVERRNIQYSLPQDGL